MNIQEASFRNTVANGTGARGERAHIGCVAFGMDRLAVAMFHTHGTDLAKWPATAGEMLALAPQAAADGHVESWR
jgi:hypothetical protein